MSDTHAITTRAFVVVERELDCDGVCVADEFVSSPTVFEWSGLPPRLRKLIANGDWQLDAVVVDPEMGPNGLIIASGERT